MSRVNKFTKSYSNTQKPPGSSKLKHEYQSGYKPSGQDTEMNETELPAHVAPRYTVMVTGEVNIDEGGGRG